MTYKICKRCIIDSSVAGMQLDELCECNYCKIHDALEKQYPLNSQKLSLLIERIKNNGRGRKFDCIVGISGGRDSSYVLYIAKQFGLRPLAVHFNDGFGNPVAGENMKKATSALSIPLRTITSDWRESKDLKIAFLKSSTPDLEQGTDIGIQASMMGVAHQENIKYIISGFSFRTEGIAPLEWNYLDGHYLKNVHRQFGTVKLRKWKPNNPGFNLRMPHLLYYSLVKRIQTIPLLCFTDYKLTEAEKVIKEELGWIYPGAKYYDDLYQSLMTYIYRTKFNIDRRRFTYSALIRSNQLGRSEALERIQKPCSIEDPKVIELCIKRLGLSKQDLERYMYERPKTFRHYKSSYSFIRYMKYPIKICSLLHILPAFSYHKYFNCG